MKTIARVRMRCAAASVCLLLLGALTACNIPMDPDRTLERVTDGTLRAGASPHDPLVIVDGGTVRGPLPELVDGFAAQRNADVEWTVDSEEALVDRLESGDLDLVIGGMTDATPWTDRVGVTRAYDGIDGTPVVVLVPMGENALQSALEAYFDREAGS